MDAVVKNNEGQHRYELLVDDEVAGVAEYTVTGDTVTIPHTEIHPDRQGNGLGAVLVKGVLDDLRTNGQQVRPYCWYVAGFIQRHPEYADLVAA